MDVPLLSMMILVPLVGTVITFLLPKNSTKAKWVCLIAALVNLFISFILVFAFVWEVPFTLVGDPVTGGFKAYENFDWVPTLGMSYTLGVDGLSIPLIVLTQLLVALGIVFSWKEEERTKEFFALLLLMDLSITGVFISLDLFLFFIFWELVLIPMYFLIGIWGGPNKHYAAIKFLIYTHVGSVIMLLGIFALYFTASPALTGGNTFNLIVLANEAGQNPTYLGTAFQVPVFIALFFGFGVKMPMVPFQAMVSSD
jgi:NADH-quinone oxidoreductase subunit M